MAHLLYCTFTGLNLSLHPLFKGEAKKFNTILKKQQFKRRTEQKLLLDMKGVVSFEYRKFDGLPMPCIYHVSLFRYFVAHMTNLSPELVNDFTTVYRR